MKKTLPLLTAFFLLLLTGCSKNKTENARFTYDYEQALGWENIQLEKGVAHSGSFSEKLTGEKEYSHGFFLPLAQVENGPYKKMKVDLWANAITINAPVYLVVKAYNPQTDQEYKAVQKDLAPELRNGTGWHHFSESLDLSTLKTNDPVFVKAFIWNNQKQALWIDDVTVAFEK